jgi:glycosyltransferase involved in cell wall biosynthesis
LHNRSKILFVGSTLDVGGGAERQWGLLIPPLRDHHFDVSVLTLVYEGRHFHDLRRRGIQASCARMRHRTDLAGLMRALGHARLRPDLVVTQSINADVVGHLIARKVRAPHVTTEHAGAGAAWAAHREGLSRLIGPRADRTVVVSRSQIPRLLKLGYRNERIRVIHNGVPESRGTEPSSLRSRLGFPADHFLAVLVATLRPEKSVDIFVRAIQTAHRAEPRVMGLVVGAGPEFQRLKTLAGDDGLVRLLGKRLDVPDILNAADAVCLSSTAEGSPMVLLEAMAAGKPIIATNVGGIPEAVEDENTGVLVPVGDCDAFAAALLRLASNPALAARLGRAGRERQRSLFSVERMVAQYAEVFEEILEAWRSRRSSKH